MKYHVLNFIIGYEFYFVRSLFLVLILFPFTSMISHKGTVTVSVVTHVVTPIHSTNYQLTLQMKMKGNCNLKIKAFNVAPPPPHISCVKFRLYNRMTCRARKYLSV